MSSIIKLEQPFEQCGDCKPHSQSKFKGGIFCTSLSLNNTDIPQKDVIKVCMQDEKEFKMVDVFHFHLLEAIGLIHVLNGAVGDFLEPFDLDFMLTSRKMDINESQKKE